MQKTQPPLLTHLGLDAVLRFELVEEFLRSEALTQDGGLPLLFPYTGWARTIAGLMGGFEGAAMVHRASAVLIIDEAQNLTPKQMKTLITRAGPGTKMVCIGNIAQIDSPYLSETTSGLTFVVDHFKGWQHNAHITLQRGERSRLADFAQQVM